MHTLTRTCKVPSFPLKFDHCLATIDSIFCINHCCSKFEILFTCNAIWQTLVLEEVFTASLINPFRMIALEVAFVNKETFSLNVQNSWSPGLLFNAALHSHWILLLVLQS